VEYELSVRLEDNTNLAELNDRADEEVKKFRGKKADQTDQHRYLHYRLCSRQYLLANKQ